MRGAFDEASRRIDDQGRVVELTASAGTEQPSQAAATSRQEEIARAIRRRAQLR